jgi:hypothetical protein
MKHAPEPFQSRKELRRAKSFSGPVFRQGRGEWPAACAGAACETVEDLMTGPPGNERALVSRPSLPPV